MARYTGPKSRIARKFGEAIFGPDKVLSNKNYPPGSQGNNRKRKSSEYGVQLREKQKAKYTYGVLEKQFSNLKKRILDTDSFYDGVQVDRNIRQKAYDSITKPVFKDENGNFMNELQKYQRENPMEFMENVALLYALTDGFKNVEKLTRKKVQAGIKRGFDEVASVLNSTRRNGDGSLNLANTAPDDSDRENWTLA
jgi:hypothetical protein